MEMASRVRWILILFVTLLVIFFTGWGLYSVARRIFTSGNNSVETSVNIYEVENTDEAKFISEGPVVSVEDHRSYEITVSQNVVMIKLLRGYGSAVITEKSYQNTESAYVTFLSALENLEVTNRNKDTDEEDDLNYAGVCPNGRTYVMNLDNEITRWSTSCARRQGTADFSMSAVKELFEKQIPDFRDVIRGTNL